MRLLGVRVLVAVAVGAASMLSACIVGGGAGTLHTGTIAGRAAGQSAQIQVEKRSLLVGTVFDFQVVRVASILELSDRKPSVQWSPGLAGDGTSTSPTYRETRILRVDVPVITLWNFDGGGISYPGTIRHRHTVDIWFRGGTSDIFQLENGGYVGAAVTYYQTGAIAIGLTLDRWAEPTSARSLELDGLYSYQSDASGWIFGLEFTLGAGEYALDAVRLILDIDNDARNIRNPERD